MRKGNEKPKSEAHCDTIYGLTEGDACYGVAQMFNLTYTEFFGFNKFNVNRSSVAQLSMLAGLNWPNLALFLAFG